MATPRDRSTLELLLCDSLEGHPTLADGLPEDAAGKAPRPDASPLGADSFSYDGRDADPNDLAIQRWAVLVADGPETEARLRAIAPLMELRAEEQGAAPKVYRVASGMTIGDATAWKRDHWSAEARAERPRYLLLLGDLDEISLETQHVLSNGPFAGRLHAPDIDGYAEYAKKVVRWARGSGAPDAPDPPASRVFVADDPSNATSMARIYLVNECIELARRSEGFPGAELGELPSSGDAGDFLRACNTPRPSVLLSVSHGMGRPRIGGWRSYDEQRALQGALLVGSAQGSNRALTAEAVRRAPFLPGGLWFCFACFGAGTPKVSAFYSWLKELYRLDAYRDPVKAVLESLPKDGERPFLAALPQAALANPEGPLALIAHIDLAWTYAFVDPQRRSRASNIFDCIDTMARGGRAGVALDQLKDPYRQVNDDLLSGYEAEKYAADWGKTSPVDPRQRGNDFMLRNDFRGYILLGDPAARLPSRANLVGAPKPAGASSSSGTPTVMGADVEAALAREVMEMERTVLDLLSERGAAGEIAERLRSTPAELERWVGAYREAGRAALRKLR